MKREKTKLRQAVRRLSVCAARLAEEAESGAADVRSVKELAAVLRELPDYVCLVFVYDLIEYKADARTKLAALLKEQGSVVLGRALEQEEEKDETVRVVLTEEVEPWSE